MDPFDLVRLLEDERVRAQGAILCDPAQANELLLVEPALMREGLLDLVRDHVDGNVVLDASRDDDVRDVALRLDVLVEVWLDESEPLLDASLDVAAAFLDVAEETSGEAEVGIGLGEDLQVEHVQDALVVEREDAFHDEDVGRIEHGGLRKPGMFLERVVWDFGYFARGLSE